MFEDGNSYEEIIERCLSSDRIATDVDKREGSVLFNAVAPAADEIALIYTLLDAVYENGFADTAEREWLVLRCKERGITPYEATYSTVKGAFNTEIPIGTRFNYVVSNEEDENEGINFAATAFIESRADGNDATYYYQLRCETAGTEGNITSGVLSAIDYIGADIEANVEALLIPAEDEEDTEDLRKRYMDSFSDTPFGGNVADYKQKTKAIDGVGGVKVKPVWNGGGTVKLIIINSNYDKASDILVDAVKETMDPFESEGEGMGLAPIGHRVTVESCVETGVFISVRTTMQDGYTWEGILSNVVASIEAYLLELRKNWENTINTVIRISQIENRILNIEGVLDVQDTTINGYTENLTLAEQNIPVLGGVENVAG